MMRRRAGQRRARYTGHPRLAWPSVDPAHGQVHRVGTDPVQGLLAIALSVLGSSRARALCFSEPPTRPADDARQHGRAGVSIVR
jgi:hypothetical protein